MGTPLDPSTTTVEFALLNGTRSYANPLHVERKKRNLLQHWLRELEGFSHSLACRGDVLLNLFNLRERWHKNWQQGGNQEDWSCMLNISCSIGFSGEDLECYRCRSFDDSADNSAMTDGRSAVPKEDEKPCPEAISLHKLQYPVYTRALKYL